MNVPSDIFEKSQEEHMQLALATIQGSGTKANGDPNYSICQAGKEFNIPQTSIAHHLKGMLFSCYIFVFLSFCEGGKTHQEVHVNEQLLTAVQEKVLVKWIKVQGCCSIPLTYVTVALYVGEISGQQVGGSSPK
jgi:helix-turn-helix, Psq domain